MAEISASDVKKLRDATAAGMKDCKAALVEANGDFEEAQKILRKKGLAAAGKREGRATNEGLIFINNSGKKALMFEMTCETAFVAQNEIFQNAGKKIAEIAVAENITSNEDDKIQEELKVAISVIKENMKIKNFNILEADANSTILDYSHDGGSIGAMVKLTAENAADLTNEEVLQFGRDVALHVVAFKPAYLNVDAVDANYKATQLEVFEDKARKSGKPENIIGNIVQGMLNKHYAEICLMNQEFVKDDTVTVEKALAAVVKSTGVKFSISAYAYAKVGQE